MKLIRTSQTKMAVNGVMPDSTSFVTQAVPQREADISRLRARRRTRLRRVFSALVGMAIVGGGAFAATNWIVGLSAGSSAEGQSATVQNLTITAVASPAAVNQLYPGGNGDVVATITNPNPYPVTITAVNLPANTTYANGYTTSALSATQTGCLSATPSDVVWNYSTATSGSTHTLTTPLTVAASGTLTVTFTDDASMTLSAPAACENTYFSLPSLTSVVATGGSATATTGPATDGWTS
ncbi:MAG: hypothetical protein WBD82_00990 [Acidimicrobiales bacterium]